MVAKKKEGEFLVEMRKAEDIHPYHRNPRDNSGAISDVAASLKANGWQQPIVVDKEGVIVVGHTRYQAALSMGWATMPVKIADLSDAAIKAYRLADNKVAERAAWNEDLLKLEVEDLMEMQVLDLDITGFKSDEIDKLLTEPVEPERDSEEKYGGATALSRGSSPLRFYREGNLLKGDVLDYGAGKEEHEFAKYDMLTNPDTDVLLRQYDTVMCNYVLNVQPTDHLIDLILVNLYHLTRLNGKILIALVSESSLSGTAATGNRPHKTPKQWGAILSRFFKITPLSGTFTGYICEKYPDEESGSVEDDAEATEGVAA